MHKEGSSQLACHDRDTETFLLLLELQKKICAVATATGPLYVFSAKYL